MRRAVGALALLLLVLLLFLATQETGQQTVKKPGDDEFSFGMRSARMASFGEKNAAVLRLFMYSGRNATVEIYCSEMPLQKNVLLLRHPSAPGINASMRERIAKELAKAGLSSREADMNDALSSENTVIIAATGAVPLSLLEAGDNISQKNSRVILLETLKGKAIAEDGSISQLNASTGFEKVKMPPGGEVAAAGEIARMALYPAGATSTWKGGAAGNFTAAVAMNSSRAYCRAIASAGGKTRFADSGELKMPKGTLVGATKTAAGKNAEFGFSLGDDSDAGRNLRFFASTYIDGEKVSSQEISGGVIVPGWESRLSLSFAKGGANIVEITDQFNRPHAAVYVDVLGLKVVPVSASGSRYEFFATLGSERLDGEVEAWIDDGRHMNYSAKNGTLVIYAAPAQGKRVMHFSSNGAQADYGFLAEGSSVIDSYVRYGIPAIILLAAACLLLRAGGKAKYRITFPQFAQGGEEIVEVEGNELCEAWKRADAKFGKFGLVYYPHEIAAALCALKGEKGGIDAYSVLRALRKCDLFSESEGAFAPANACREFSVSQLRVMRLLHDIMLENGITFKKARVIPAGRGSEFFVFGEKDAVLAKMGRGKRIVVFESNDALEEFERGLDAPGKENVRIKLALENGKISLISANRRGIEAVL